MTGKALEERARRHQNLYRVTYPLKQYRRENLMSLEEFSRASGLHIQTLWRIENDRTLASRRTMMKLAKALNVEPADLVDDL
jgi:transcriptional regulator with XRE-family HTH domain